MASITLDARGFDVASERHRAAGRRRRDGHGGIPVLTSTLSPAQSTGVTLPQPLTLTPVTPVVAPLVHYV